MSQQLKALKNSGECFHLTIIAPVYNESASISDFHDRLDRVIVGLSGRYQMTCDILYIDDGSQDNVGEVISQLSSPSAKIRYVAFSRNFGKEAALAAGVDLAAEGAIVFIDSDGQHPPEMILQMVTEWRENQFDIIYTYQPSRQDGLGRKFLSRLIYKMINRGDISTVRESSSDFRLMSPRALAALKKLDERARFFKGLSVWVGFKQKGLEYKPELRIAGETKWSPLSLLSFAVSSVVSFSLFPLRILMAIGATIAIISFAYGSYIIVEVVFSGIPLPGYPSLIVSNVFLGGILIFMVGVLGEYIGQILKEVKARPLYIIASDDVSNISEMPKEKNDLQSDAVIEK